METDKRREQFIMAALQLFSEKGITKTSIGDISTSVGVARSLFYHYFPNKTAIINAVVENRVDDFVNQFVQWNKAYKLRSTRQSLGDIVTLLRNYLTDPKSICNIVAHEDSRELWQKFSVQSANKLSQRYAERRSRGPMVANQSVVRHPKESFYMLTIGVISTLLRFPEIPDETIVEVIADLMHIPLE